MMKRLYVLVVMLAMLILVGAAFGQTNPNDKNATPTPPPSLEIFQELGRALPRQMLYDPNFERIAIVDAYGRFLLMDALTYKIQYVLHDLGSYNDFIFSHDGRWLGLIVGQNMELWDTQTGKRVAVLEDPSQAITLQGPLSFSRDNNLLLFYGVYPAPQALRRSENDTSITPWLWNLTAARNEGTSTFPRKVEAWQFFDYRFGFVLGPDNRIVAALPGRLHVLDAYSLKVLYEIPTDRYEQDPLTVSFSLRDNKIYVRPVRKASLIQVDTQRGVLVELPLNKSLTTNDLQTVGGVELSDQARVIGQPKSTTDNALLRALLGNDYRRAFSFHPLTVTLIDLITPPDNGQDQLQPVLFIFDETAQTGFFNLPQNYGIQQFVLNPDNKHALIRFGDSVQVYDLDTGAVVKSLVPALRDLGGYSRRDKNRLLAYDTAGRVIISDFQRFDAADGKTLAEDLHYSQRFDRFFFTNDSKQIVTQSGDEWRLWDIASGNVVKRQVLPLRGDIIATSSDGFRYLTLYQNGTTEGVETFDAATGKKRGVTFAAIRGRSIQDVIPSPDWEHYFVIYSPNQYGPYSPGNEVAIYELERGQLWFFAGDDLPPPQNRQYGWTGNDTAYIAGQSGGRRDMPARIYGADFAPDGTPSCLLNRFPAQAKELSESWYTATLKLRGDDIARLAVLVCEKVADGKLPSLSANANQVIATATPPVIAGVPACLTARYPNQADAYAQQWKASVAGLSAEARAKAEKLLCEGIGTPQPANTRRQEQSPMMLIEAATGIRYNGSYIPPRDQRPIQPILDEYFRTTRRQLNSAVLSPDNQLLAASNLPGELIIYRLVTSYQTLLGWETATVAAKYVKQNRIAALPTFTPTLNPIGTARPTLTPTVTPTSPPRPLTDVNLSQRDEVKDFCPAEKLLTVDALPPNYSPIGQLVGPATGDTLWTVNPLSGKRGPDDTIPKCGTALQCKFSPDNSMILVDTVNEIYTVRPDGTGSLIFFDKTKRYPQEIQWTGAKTLEWRVFGEIPGAKGQYGEMLQRSIPGVNPDPDPWFPQIIIRQRLARVINRQPGGPYVIAALDFSTGIGPGSEFYLYNSETKQAVYFARQADLPNEDLQMLWHPLGDRLFYAFIPRGQYARPVWYQFDPKTGEHLRLGNLYNGQWSNDGRYTAFSTGRRTQQVAVWDSQTGLTRTYCVPETGARAYGGGFWWSPDSRYLALQAPLPKDESKEGVGQHTLVLDIANGNMIDLTTGIGPLTIWMQPPGSYPKPGQGS